MIAVYDLMHCPPTYDIVAFLMLAEAERRRRNQPVIDVHILPGPVGGFRADGLWPYTIAERLQMLQQVAIPMCKLLPTVLTVTVPTVRPTGFAFEFGYGSYFISLSNILAGLRAGGRCLHHPEPVQKELDLVTITLREADHWPLRNSHVSQWVIAAKELREAGFHVVFIRDTMRADEPLEGFDTAPHASRDLFERSRLYSSALMNLGISNGPMWFALALNVPVLMLRPTTETTTGPFGNDFFRSQGLPVGSQLPNTPPQQRLVWRPDMAQEIMTAFNEMVPWHT